MQYLRKSLAHKGNWQRSTIANIYVLLDSPLGYAGEHYSQLTVQVLLAEMVMLTNAEGAHGI